MPRLCIARAALSPEPHANRLAPPPDGAQGVLVGGKLTMVNGAAIVDGQGAKAVAAAGRPVTLTIQYSGGTAITDLKKSDSGGASPGKSSGSNLGGVAEEDDSATVHVNVMR